MYKGPSMSQPTEPQKYEYRVEMISHRNRHTKVTREYQSEFEVGECWGYNRFYRIDQLEPEGYLSADAEDCIFLKFYVRPPTYHQLSRDQERYVLDLEKKIQHQEDEISQLRKKEAENAKKQKKHHKQGKKPQDKEESKSPLLLSNEEVPHKVKKIKLVRNEPPNRKDDPKGASRVSSTAVKSDMPKESWDEHIAASDQKMDQATGLISVSESEEEKDEELATVNAVESRKKDVKKAKAAANASSTAAMFGQIGMSSDDEDGDEEDLGADSEEEEDGDDVDEDPNFLVSEDNAKQSSPLQEEALRNNFFAKMQGREETRSGSGSKNKAKSVSN